MDFLNFFGLREDPFKLTPDPAYFYPSTTHNEGLLLLDYSIEQKEGFTTVIGDPGSGKTTLLNVFLEKWKTRAEIAIILTPRLSPEEFLVSVLEDLKIGLKRKNKNEIIKAFRDFMIERSSEGKRVIIIVDEAQNLPDDTLEELRLLSNLETDKDKLLQIILLGQPELEAKLTSVRLRQLNQRITTRIHLRHFNPAETLDYINYRTIKAGKQNLQIDRKAAGMANRLSKGVPRLINMLISRALMAAYLEESNVLLSRHINHAAKSLDHSEMKPYRRSGLTALSAVVVSAFLIIGAVYLSMQHIKAKTPSVPQKAGPQRTDTGKSAQPPSTAAVSERPADSTEVKTVDAGQASFKLVSVKVDIANVREKPELDSTTVVRLSKDSQLPAFGEYVDDRNVKWFQVSYRGGKHWISEEVAEEVDLSGGRLPDAPADKAE
ncbi:MAG: general secretion pathway protein [Nitrospiraceae bacterium]|nr:MAG: general secretion pathway protein [Nitrospiraceae bacterium]